MATALLSVPDLRKNSVFNHFMSIPRTILYITRVAEVDWLSANAKNTFNTFFGRIFANWQ